MNNQNHPTIAKLLDLMDASPGFSGLGETMKIISRISDAEDGGMKEVTEAILKDAALTARLLRYANSSRNALSGRNVSTIDQAITILGFNTVKSVALSLSLLNCLSNRPQSDHLHAEIAAAYFCGSLAHEITRCNAPSFGPQEAQVCGLLQNIGRMMALYHLFDDIEKARALQIGENLTEDEAVTRALGVGFEEIGAAVARHWNLPAAIEESIAAKIDRTRPRVPEGLGWSQLAAVFSRRIMDTLFRLPENQESVEIDNNIRIFYGALKLKNKETLGWMNKAMEETDALLSDVAFPCNTEQARKLLRRSSERVFDRLYSHDSLAKKDIFDPNKKIPVEIFQQALRVIHDAFHFDRTLLCLAVGRDLTGIAGVGRNAMQVASQFRLRGNKPDIFRIVMQKQVDLFIADTASPSVADFIPEWYPRIVGARAFMLLSLAGEGEPLGLLYGDYSEPPRASPQSIAAQEAVKKSREQIRAALLTHTVRHKA
jgi:eukaryotic-like serine/threonine-protein kinase